MTNEQINIAIAEACGWHEELEPLGSFNATAWWHNNYRYPSNVMPVPNYCKDLNAMHEAEKTLTDDQFEQYRWILWDISPIVAKKDWYRCYLSSTAHQRAEAFLKTLEKWEEA
jgi:hypothetical protein